MGFKDNLKNLMDYKDITLKELSFLTGISKGSLSNYLKENSSIPSADIAVKIADALSVSVEFLVKGKTNSSSNMYLDYPNEVKEIIDKFNRLSKEKQIIVKNLIESLDKLPGNS